jgi:hypothetical protein
MSTDGYFMSPENPLATTDQREVEDMALRVVRRPELQRAKALAGHLWREVAAYPAAEQMSRFDGMIEEYVFHHALRAATSDPNQPRVARFMAPAHRWFGRDVPGSRWAGDSPDFIYRMISVGHGGRYEIRGRPTCADPPTVNYALMSDNTAAPSILGLLDSLDMTFEADGGFVITVDAQPAEGRPNHIQAPPGAWQVWVRDALGDWLAQSPNALRVVRLDPPDRAPLTEDEIARRAARSALDGLYYAYFCTRSTTALEPNVMLGPQSSGPLGGMATQRTCRVNACLAPDEAMIVTTTAAGALFRNAVLQDVFMISLDYWARVSSLNMAQMAADADGRFTYVIAHEDPGVHNWLDTGGLRQTIFGQRWQAFAREGGHEEPQVWAQVVKLRDLESALPDGVRRVDGAGRREQLALRAAGFRRRFIDG